MDVASAAVVGGCGLLALCAVLAALFVAGRARRFYRLERALLQAEAELRKQIGG